jgi:hypothetical protein
MGHTFGQAHPKFETAYMEPFSEFLRHIFRVSSRVLYILYHQTHHWFSSPCQAGPELEQRSKYWQGRGGKF